MNGAGGMNEAVEAGLFQRRTVLVTGALDDVRAGSVAAQLMTLDATGDAPIQIHLDCGDATIEAAFVVMDVIDLAGVDVHVTCVGRADGAAAGILAVAAHRRIAPHARVHLSEPRVAYAGHAADVERWSRHHQDQLARFQRRFAEATGRPLEQVEADMRTGRYLDAEAAVVYGLADEVWRREAGTPPPARDFGFGFRPPG